MGRGFASVLRHRGEISEMDADRSRSFCREGLKFSSPPPREGHVLLAPRRRQAYHAALLPVGGLSPRAFAVIMCVRGCERSKFFNPRHGWSDPPRPGMQTNEITKISESGISVSSRTNASNAPRLGSLYNWIVVYGRVQTLRPWPVMYRCDAMPMRRRCAHDSIRCDAMLIASFSRSDRMRCDCVGVAPTMRCHVVSVVLTMRYDAMSSCGRRTHDAIRCDAIVLASSSRCDTLRCDTIVLSSRPRCDTINLFAVKTMQCDEIGDSLHPPSFIFPPATTTPQHHHTPLPHHNTTHIPLPHHTRPHHTTQHHTHYHSALACISHHYTTTTFHYNTTQHYHSHDHTKAHSHTTPHHDCTTSHHIRKQIPKQTTLYSICSMAFKIHL